MAAGVVQVMTGAALLTVRMTVAVAVLYSVVVVGVNVTESVCEPAASVCEPAAKTVPAASE